MYLGHRVSSLGFLYRDRLPGVPCPSLVDLVPGLREAGTEILLASLRYGGRVLLLLPLRVLLLRLQRDKLQQILVTAGFPGLALDRRLSSGAEQGVRQVGLMLLLLLISVGYHSSQVIHSLQHLAKVWRGVLPSTVYLRSMGTLLNYVMEELVTIVTQLEDISADAGGQLVSLLSQLTAKTPDLFTPEQPQRYVKRWGKFEEVGTVHLVLVVDLLSPPRCC